MASATLRIRLTPRSGKNELGQVVDGILQARVTAPPVDGSANQALIELLSDRLHIRKTAITIKSGASSREKTIIVDGFTQEEVDGFLRGSSR